MKCWNPHCKAEAEHMLFFNDGKFVMLCHLCQAHSTEQFGVAKSREEARTIAAILGLLLHVECVECPSGRCWKCDCNEVLEVRGKRQRADGV